MIKSAEERVKQAYKKLLESRLEPDSISSHQNNKNEELPKITFDPIAENKIIAEFLENSCGCGRNCQKQFSAQELLASRESFRILSSAEKNCCILTQLRLFLKSTKSSTSSSTKSDSQRQKFEYQIVAGKPICKTMFLFYHGETIKRLKRLQESFSENKTLPPVHGNKGVKPAHTYSPADIERVKSFIINLSENYGLVDPGRDVRKGKGHLRILLPSIMNYTSIHKSYEQSITELGKKAVGYRTFLEIWQKELSYIEFNKPRTDLCMTCENFKKAINQLTSSSDENREKMLIALYEEAINHLKHVQNERSYYKAHSKIAALDYKELESKKENFPSKANSKDILMSYSWDFAQQFQYPFEDQQVGPIYFKTPRRAQLFGVCCEGSGSQVNYLIDEADFIEKNANMVISLLDHFFLNYGLGEMSAYLTADNCVGQNKNNALIQYLMYRVLSKLHNKIEMSFLVVGHTKFSPDSHFGLIRQHYRISSVYTFDQLAKVVEESAKGHYNVCQRYSSDASKPGIIYRDWSSWLSTYFKQLPNITSYHHFTIDAKEKGVVVVKNEVDSKEERVNLIKRPIDVNLTIELPPQVFPEGLSLERQWYLYDNIRGHIPSEKRQG